MTAISTLMTKGPLVTVRPQTWVAEAARTISEAGVSHLLVTGDDNRLLAVMCACDLDRISTGTQLVQHMHDAPITIQLNTEVDVALEIMRSRNISCLPVLENGQLSGVVTLSDLQRNGLAGDGEFSCSACGSHDHVRCNHGRNISLCIECSHRAEALDSADEFGGGD